jgi:hypothetical protein
MELVAWLAGETHSDEPKCACPAIGVLIRAANDLCHDPAVREQTFRGLAARLVNSRTSDEVSRRRAFLALDVTARFLAPLHLDRIGHSTAAVDLRAAVEVVDAPTAAVAAAMCARHGLPLRAATWTLRQAAAGQDSRVWLSGVAHAAYRANAITVVRRIVLDMLSVRRVPN